jgi:hypothetical protein
LHFPLKQCAMALIACACTSTFAEEPVRHVPVFVQPFYQSGNSPRDTPMVAVAGKYDQLLASNDPATIQQVARGIEADPALITPMTLMVLAIRNYDVGLRDDSVFWFYVAKDRYSTLSAVADMRNPALFQARQATVAFADLAGATINGYAFCDLQKQAAARLRAIKWVEEHPYQVIFSEQIPAKPGDRKELLQASIRKLKDDVAKEAEYLQRPDTLEKLTTARKKNGVDEKYCW